MEKENEFKCEYCETILFTQDDIKTHQNKSKKCLNIQKKINYHKSIIENDTKFNSIQSSEENIMNKIKILLGKPYYEQENRCLIYNGDSLIFLKLLPEFSDLTITSPPYNIGKEYEINKSVDEYIIWSKEWIDLIYKITMHNGSFWLNLGYMQVPNIGKAVPIIYLLWDKIPFYLIQEIIWHYEAGVACKNSLSPRNEKLLWYVKNKSNYTFNLDVIRDTNVKYPNQKKDGKLKCNPLGKNPSDVWNIPKVTSGKNRSCKERTQHPAQFPENLVKRIILACSNENDIIFDPFLGSGTTAYCALKLNRKVIGFEINKNYCDIAINRISTLLVNENNNI